MIVDSLFYLFSAVLLMSALLVITARNPVHAVLFLILAFFNAAGLFLLLGAEFLAMLLVVVYVGAVMVLFLFVVMMLDVNFSRLRGGFVRYLPLGLGVAGVLLVELVASGLAWSIASPQSALPMPDDVDNTRALGQVIYTHYIYLFQGAGLILLVAMIGAIVLTLRNRPGVRRQNISDQLARRGADEITLVSGR